MMFVELLTAREFEGHIETFFFSPTAYHMSFLVSPIPHVVSLLSFLLLKRRFLQFLSRHSRWFFSFPLTSRLLWDLPTLSLIHI